jgi:hypothetical protein
MLLMYGAEAGYTEPERQACMLESLGVCGELAAQNKLLAASPLHSVLTATSLRIRDGKRLITDGPFAETTEQLGGYYIIDVANLDEAIAIASRLPPAKKGTVEIRPVFDITELQQPDPRDIITRRDLPFRPRQIWDAFQNPERLARWWGPDGFTNSFETFDFRPGSEWVFVMHCPDGKNYDNRIVFDTLDAPRRIVFTHVPAPWFQTTIELQVLTESTTHFHWRMRFESPEMREKVSAICIPANEQNLNRLTQELSRTAR